MQHDWLTIQFERGESLEDVEFLLLAVHHIDAGVAAAVPHELQQLVPVLIDAQQERVPHDDQQRLRSRHRHVEPLHIN